jgi:hypothetical protein
MAIEISNVIVAMGSLGATGVAVWEVGATGSNTGAGNYALTLDTNCSISANESAVFVTQRTTAGLRATVVHTNASSKAVVVQNNANANTNGAFDWMICAAPAV